MAAGSGGGLLLRCAAADTEALATEPDVGRFVMRGREMTGWLRVDPPAFGADADLARWVAIGVAEARRQGGEPPT